MLCDDIGNGFVKSTLISLRCRTGFCC